MSRVAMAILVLTILSPCMGYGQVGIGTKDIDASAILQVEASTNDKGILLPRLTIEQRDAINTNATAAGETVPAGLTIYCTDCFGTNSGSIYYYNGVEWRPIDNNGQDTAPPSAPTSLAASNPTTSSIDLSWTASTDNVGVTGYYIYFSNNTLAATVTSGTSTTISGLSALSLYTFYATAFDAAGNESSSSNNASETTTQPCLVVGDYDSTHQGVVFWVNPSDCSNYKIISMNNIVYNSDETLRYSKNTDESGQESHSDGYGNNLNWIQDLNTARNYRSDQTNDNDIRNTALFAAFNYYGGTTNGWYLGAPAEWDEVYDNKSNINTFVSNKLNQVKHLIIIATAHHHYI